MMTNDTHLTAQNLLAFARVQVAAEALFDLQNKPPSSPLSETVNKAMLTKGNKHSSKFTPAEASEFIDNWKVVDHISNTKTGFSGTLFEAKHDIAGTNIKEGDQVISFRSTEFIDDAVRDNKATNELEIKEKGFAFGQISDMRDWVLSLQAPGQDGQSKLKSSVSVTGYSLGGHLATAFNMLNVEEAFGNLKIKNTYTFNGAGVGRVNSDHTLQEVIDIFKTERNTDHSGEFHTKIGKFYFDEIKNINYDENIHYSLFSIIERMNNERTDNLNSQDENSELTLLINMATEMGNVAGELSRIRKLDSGGEPPEKPFSVSPENIAAIDIDYQLALLKVTQYTKPVHTGILENVLNAGNFFDNTRQVEPLIDKHGIPVSGFYDVYASNPPSMVSISQIHRGESVGVIVEDQPLKRGWYALNVLK